VQIEVVHARPAAHVLERGTLAEGNRDQPTFDRVESDVGSVEEREFFSRSATGEDQKHSGTVD
jgi:hypothetical protein